MNIPFPPTDNLYKFAAISGTIIILLSLYVPIKYINELNIRYDSINLKRHVLEVERFARLGKLKKLNEIIENTIKDKNNKNKVIKIYYSKSEIKKMIAEHEALDIEIKLKEAEINSYHEVNSEIINRIKRYKSIVVWLTTFGAALAVAGYMFWYLKVQKYQDIYLKYNAYNNYCNYIDKQKVRKKIRYSAYRK